MIKDGPHTDQKWIDIEVARAAKMPFSDLIEEVIAINTRVKRTPVERFYEAMKTREILKAEIDKRGPPMSEDIVDDDFEKHLRTIPTETLLLMLDKRTPKHLRLVGERANFARRLLVERSWVDKTDP